jgi:hypothetical protein
MTTNTVEQQKILYAKQVAAHTIRLWSSIRTVQMMAGYDLKAKQLNEPPTPTLNESQSSDQDNDEGLNFKPAFETSLTQTGSQRIPRSMKAHG